ncbi:MAG TPA: hypothetical protein VFO98_03385 [Marmoricola sp.]|jgi:hypothetical protein|nr:hypothetical protein [Marmoricola sp.]
MLLPPSRRSPVAIAVAVLVGVLAAGCSDDAPAKPEPSRPTPIGKLDTAAVVIPRIAFCDLVPDDAVQDALGGAAAESQEWGTGEPAARVVGGRHDATHEFGCSWSGTGGTTASAWVFARPVTAAFAQQVVRQASSAQGCTTPPAGAFGAPTELQVCTLPGATERVRRAGLFGDTWLTCQVTAPAGATAALRERADAWCVQLTHALDTAR